METLRTIQYYPQLREYVGSINAVLIVSHLEKCFQKRGEKFSKFMEPCEHFYYKPGESWVEVLHMTGTEFRTAFKRIGTVYKSKKEYNCSQDKFQGKMYLSYYDRISKLTYYMRNDELVEKIFNQHLGSQGVAIDSDEEVKEKINKRRVQNAKEEKLNENNGEAQDIIIDIKQSNINDESLSSNNQAKQHVQLAKIEEDINKERLYGVNQETQIVEIRDVQDDRGKAVSNTINQENQDVTNEAIETLIAKEMRDSNTDEEQSFQVDEWAKELSEEYGYTINHKIEDGINHNKTNVLMSLENNKTNNKINNKTQSKTNITNDNAVQADKRDQVTQYIQESQTPKVLQEHQGQSQAQEYQAPQKHQAVQQNQAAQENKQEIDFNQVLEVIKDLFNHICYSHDEILEWTGNQEQKIGELWWIYDHNLEIFKTAFEKIEISDFLSGRIKNWKASIDWILMPSHFADILRDKYKNFKKLNKSIDAMKGAESDDRWDFDEIEINAYYDF